jgi:hypothetical protein
MFAESCERAVKGACKNLPITRYLLAAAGLVAHDHLTGCSEILLAQLVQERHRKWKMRNRLSPRNIVISAPEGLRSAG